MRHKIFDPLITHSEAGKEFIKEINSSEQLEIRAETIKEMAVSIIMKYAYGIDRTEKSEEKELRNYHEDLAEGIKGLIDLGHRPLILPFTKVPLMRLLRYCELMWGNAEVKVTMPSWDDICHYNNATGEWKYSRCVNVLDWSGNHKNSRYMLPRYTLQGILLATEVFREWVDYLCDKKEHCHSHILWNRQLKRLDEITRIRTPITTSIKDWKFKSSIIINILRTNVDEVIWKYAEKHNFADSFHVDIPDIVFCPVKTCRFIKRAVTAIRTFGRLAMQIPCNWKNDSNQFLLKSTIMGLIKRYIKIMGEDQTNVEATRELEKEAVYCLRLLYERIQEKYE